MATVSECIARVQASGGLACHECHISAKVVSKALSGRAIAKCEAGSLGSLLSAMDTTASHGRDKVYRVDADGLGHSFSIVQCRNKFVIMQSWVSSYSLQEWLLGTKGELKENGYLPNNGENDYEFLKTYLTIMSEDLSSRRVGYAQSNAQRLFNPLNANMARLRGAIGSASGKPLSIKWQGEAIH
ncbi:hypothetical protein EDC56_1489 [Sinobacterium caligoides]|uniref:Uncharacterized protein n=1 Tax=Sinobacterium caligoides TaxID=933926 RepID=A0A3N2DP14_9GAMM|nr:hypothetical protein [Sinobacterium caligoides]ROS01065.1 hypothetical protein EDC56_1489 [Sinobacterium caligoides]